MSHCYDDPCKNNGTCRDHSVNYTCECLPGFMGELCQGKHSGNYSLQTHETSGLESLYTCLINNLTGSADYIYVWRYLFQL